LKTPCYNYNRYPHKNPNLKDGIYWYDSAQLRLIGCSEPLKYKYSINTPMVGQAFT
jgi:hypothetical protein